MDLRCHMQSLAASASGTGRPLLHQLRPLSHPAQPSTISFLFNSQGLHRVYGCCAVRRNEDRSQGGHRDYRRHDHDSRGIVSGYSKQQAAHVHRKPKGTCKSEGKADSYQPNELFEKAIFPTIRPRKYKESYARHQALLRHVPCSHLRRCRSLWPQSDVPIARVAHRRHRSQHGST